MNRLKIDRILEVASLLSEGKSMRSVSRATGHSLTTVRRYQREFVALDGWCKRCGASLPLVVVALHLESDRALIGYD